MHILQFKKRHITMIPTQKLQFNVILFSLMLLLRGNLFLPLPVSTTMGSENQVIDSCEEEDVAEVSYLVWNSLGLFFGSLLPPKTLYFTVTLMAATVPH
jgi:hypothetical protein